MNVQTQHPERSSRPMNRMLQLSALTLLLLSFAPLAFAQQITPLSDQSRTWQNNIGAQLGETLASDSQDLQGGALQQVLALARHYGGDLNLKATVPGVVAICASHPDEQYRLTAVAALHALGDEDGMQQLYSLFTKESSARVQLAMMGALMQHYGPETFEHDGEAAATARRLLRDLKADRAAASARWTTTP